MRIHKRLLGLAIVIAVLATLVALVMLGNTDLAIVVAAAAVLVGMSFLRRYARVRLVYDIDSAPSDEASGPTTRR